MSKWISLVLNTAREIMRQPVIAIISTVCIVTIGIMPVLAVFSLGQEARIVRDGAAASCLFYGLFLVAASSIAAIYRQIQAGTAGSILCKPVSREVFLTATYAGIVLVCLMFTVTSLCAGMISVRMAYEGIHTDWMVGTVLLSAVILAFAVAGILNYIGRSFCAVLVQALLISMLAAVFVTAVLAPGGKMAGFGKFMPWQMLPSGILIFMALAMLAAIAVALSTRFPPVAVLFCCFLVMALGLVSDFLIAIIASRPVLSALCACFLPNWQIFWIYGGAQNESFLTAAYLLQAIAYAALYIAGVLCLGLISFKKIDV